jgi:GR25 family glycosyltransferase involved in LPS biosynthesis
MINFSLIKDMDTSRKNFEMYSEYISSINSVEKSIQFIRSIVNRYIEEGKLFELLEVIYLINTCVEKYSITNISEFNDIIEKIYHYHKNIKVKILYLTSCLDLGMVEQCDKIINESQKSEQNYLTCIRYIHEKNLKQALIIYNKDKNKYKYPSLFGHILRNIEIDQQAVKSINNIVFSLVKNNQYHSFIQIIEQYLTKIIEHEYIDIETFLDKVGGIKNNLKFVKDFVSFLIEVENFDIAKKFIALISSYKNKISNGIAKELNDLLLSKVGISLVVACMNREENLVKILKSWINVPYIREFIIIDYSSKNPLQENMDLQKLSQQKNVKIIRVENETVFNLGRAYNIGFDLSKENYILKIDSDYQLIDSAFLDNLLLNKNMKNYFVKGDFTFSSSMSGFFLIHRDNLLPFREDLNGYGFDEIDLHNRIKQHKPQIKEIIWFNIEKSIYHIPHSNIDRGINYQNKDIIKTEQDNRYMCSVHSPTFPTRKNYTIEDKVVHFNKEYKFPKILCINLANREDRWNNIKHIEEVERFEAIEVNLNNYETVLLNNAITFQPVNLTSKYYFTKNPGAFGAYLSHYKVWEKIVEENIPYTLVLEDDIDISSLQSLMNSNIIFENHELIQLSLRMHWHDNRMIFNGGEAYILSLSAAQKLISATNCPTLLNYVKPVEEDSIVAQSIANGAYTTKYNWSGKKSITCPVDKFMGYCCEERANDFIKIKSYLYPCIKLNQSLSKQSSIETR